MEIKQNTLYLTTPKSYVSRDHLNLKIEIDREVKLSVPIHHLESVCIFGQVTLSAHALQLCWEQGVPVNYFSENVYRICRWQAVPNTSFGLRRSQFRTADDSRAAVLIARQFVAGKMQNARQILMRSARESDSAEESAKLQECSAEI